MPLVTISFLKIWSAEQKKGISDKIHEALVEAFQIPDHDYNHRINEYDPGNYFYSTRKTEKAITIEMTVFPGRSKEAKKALYEKIVTKLSEYAIPAQDINVVLHEPPLENWGLGGKPGDEVKLGFELKV
ncbi:MAG TPA: tautomerase family protein [Bacillota bacterium]|nr:tautomerase family protein [Bacillota bacterium]